jgi:zinc protease
MSLAAAAVTAQPLDRSHPPAPGPPPKAAFPPFIERKLSSGIMLLVVENHEQPLAAINVVFRAGSARDGELPGLADVTAEMMTHGTATRSATEISEAIDFVGGYLNVSARWDATVASVNVLTTHLDAGLALLSDVILHPAFTPDELERVRELHLANLRQLKADADYLAATTFSRAIYGDHPYGKPQSGTEASLGRITRDDCARFHQTFLCRKNAFIVVAGDVTADAIMPALEDAFRNWPAGDPPDATVQAPVSEKSAKVLIVDKPGAVQAVIRVGHLGVRRGDADFADLSAMNTLLGGYFNSRINMNLRERRGFTYSAGSSFDARMSAGAIAAYASVRTAVADSAVDELLSELRRITAAPVEPDELSMMQNYVAGSFPLTVETPMQVASQLQAIELYHLPKDYFSSFPARVRALTAARVQELAKTYLHPDDAVIVVAGNAAKLKPMLERFGPVKVTSADSDSTR